jgi:hypothetical protein
MRAVTFEDEDLSFDALLLGAVADGSWAELRGALTRGLAAERAGAPTDTAAVREAESSFRRARGLLAGEDLRSWLDEREVTLGDWRSHVRRMLAAEEHLLATPEAFPELGLPDAARVAVAVEGLVGQASDVLLLGVAAGSPALAEDTGDQARALAGRAADDLALPLADRALGRLTVEAAEVLRLRGQLDRARTEIAAETVREAIAEHLLDWTVLVYDELVLPTEQAAREAALCLGEDGMDLEEVGRLAGAPPLRCRVSAQDADPRLLAGSPGAPLGPVSSVRGWQVIVLRERRAPSPDEPQTRERARELALRRVLDRRLAGRVLWHVVH